MLLMTNGCSFTQGIYDNFPEYNAWPYQLGRLLGWDVFNLAKGGGSNARIFRTTMEYLLENQPNYVAIAWTQTDRHELPYRNGDTVRIMHSQAMPEVNEDIKDIPELRQFWYKHCDNNLAGIQRTVYYIRSLIMVLTARNIPYTMSWAMQSDYITQIQTPGDPMCKDFDQDQLLKVRTQIDDMQLGNWLCWGSSMETELAHLPSADSLGHPGVQGQAIWANLMADNINETLHTAR